MRISFEPHGLLVFIFVTCGGGGERGRLSGARVTGPRPLPCYRLQRLPAAEASRCRCLNK